MKTTFKILALSAAIASIAACQSADTSSTKSVTHTKSVDLGPSVATVNGAIVPEAFVEMARKQGGQRGMHKSHEDIVNELIQLEVLAQEAKKEGILDQPEVQAQLAVTRKGLLANALMRAHVESIDQSDDALKAYYDEKMKAAAAQMTGSEYKARHILVKEEAEAIAIIAELDKGADFAELAKEKSTGPSGPNGGDLGWFPAEQMVPAFGEALKTMETGKFTSTPVKTRFGFHVILLEDTRAKQPPSFDSVKDQVRKEFIGKQLEAWVDELESKAKVERAEVAAPAAAATDDKPSTDVVANPHG